MALYVDRGCQTLIKGLTHDPVARPAILSHHTDPTALPDDVTSGKMQLSFQAAHKMPQGILKNKPEHLLWLRRKAPPAVAHVPMPVPMPREDMRADGVSTEGLPSPPPTEIIMSPLPALNKLYAGHTPIMLESFSPQPQSVNEPSTPNQEDYLTGPLTLPPQPGDGAKDTISLSVLDAELKKLHVEQVKAEQAAVHVLEERQSCSAHDRLAGSAGRTSSPNLSSEQTPNSTTDEREVVDGIIMKKPKMNMGAPLGQA